MPGVPLAHASQFEFVMVARSVEAFPGGELSRKLEESFAEDFDDGSLSARERAEADRHKSYPREHGRMAPSVAHATDK
jgi:hypothetical protein